MANLETQILGMVVIVACVLAPGLAQPKDENGPSKGKGKGDRFFPAICRVVNGTSVWEQDCGSKNLDCVPPNLRGSRPGRPAKRHAFMKDWNICLRKNCTTSDNCDGVECSRGKCQIPREQRMMLAACQIDEVPKRPCPPSMHCATMCAKNVTIDGVLKLVAECHINADAVPSTTTAATPGQPQGFQDLDGDGENDADEDADGDGIDDALEDADGDGDDDDDGDGDDGDK